MNYTHTNFSDNNNCIESLEFYDKMTIDNNQQQPTNIKNHKIKYYTIKKNTHTLKYLIINNNLV